MNKINIEITADGWRVDVTLNGKTYTERHVSEDFGTAQCEDGDFESEEAIPENLYDALNDFFCFNCQQALLDIENGEDD